MCKNNSILNIFGCGRVVFEDFYAVDIFIMSQLADQSSSPVAEELKRSMQRGGGGSAGVRRRGYAFSLCLLLGDRAGNEADPAAGEQY